MMLLAQAKEEPFICSSVCLFDVTFSIDLPKEKMSIK